MKDARLMELLHIKDVKTNYSVKDIEDHKILAALSYFFPFWILTVILCRKSRYTIFHSRQAAVLTLIEVVFAFLACLIGTLLLPVSLWFGALFIPLWLICTALLAGHVLYAYSALTGKAKTLPFLDVLAED